MDFVAMAEMSLEMADFGFSICFHNNIDLLWK